MFIDALQSILQSGSMSPELSTPSCSDTSLAIRQLYGHSIAKELLHVTTSNSNDSAEADDPEAWSAEAHFTNANYQGKKTAFLLFINRPFLAVPMHSSRKS
jgi:DNA mismatch repair protein MLH1